MAELFVYRGAGGLIPASIVDVETLKHLPERRVFTITANPKPVAKLTRWYRACLHILAQGLGVTSGALHVRIMLETARYESLIIGGDGTTKFTPQTTVDWGVVEWRAYMDDALPIIAKLAGETGGQIRRRVDDFLGLRFKEAYAE